jgi:site-specific recombinase XerD
MATLLQDYVAQKTPKEVIISEDCPLFSFTNRGEIHPCTVSQVFHRLVPKLGLQIQPRQSAPRLHDLRHSFAVGTLIRWYRSGKNPGSTLLQLSTFLGHVDISSTAVYLQMTSELLTEANLRFEAYATPAFEEELI